MTKFATVMLALAMLMPIQQGFAAGPEVPIDLEMGENVAIDGIPPGPPPPADQVLDIAHKIGLDLRCPVCQGMSVADSTSATAVKIQQRIRELVKQGYSEDQIKDYFLDRYGEFILLEPKKEGLNLIIYIGPGLVLGGGIGWAIMTAMSWAKEPDEVPLPSDEGLVEMDKYEKQLLAELED